MCRGAVAVQSARACLLQSLPAPRAGHARLFLCRHGETEWNKQNRIQGNSGDPPLNERGLQQASFVAEAFAGIPLDLVASSTLLRASNTADAILARQAAATRRRRLAEFVERGLGELEGRLRKEPEIGRRYEEVLNSKEDVVPAGGESRLEVRDRALRGLKDLGLLVDEDSASGQDAEKVPRQVALVAHGTLNKLLLCSLMGKELHEWGSIVQGNCCVNVVDFDPDGGCEVRAVNLDVLPKMSGEGADVSAV